jgi:predicted transcriptional regulator
MSDTFEFEKRKKIYEFIEKNPGVNVSTIAVQLQLSTQLIDYHVFYLERQGLISISKEQGYKRIYCKDSVGEHDKQLLSLLRQKIPLQIALYLLQNPYSRYNDIFKNLGISSPRFSYHLQKLIRQGIIEMSMSDGRNGYVLCNEKEIVSFLIRYKPTTVIENVKDTWDKFTPG